MHPQSVASQRVSEIMYHHHRGIADSRFFIEATWETTQSVLNGFGVSILEKRREEFQGFKLRSAGGICDVVLPFGPIPSRLRPFRLAVRKVLAFAVDTDDAGDIRVLFDARRGERERLACGRSVLVKGVLRTAVADHFLNGRLNVCEES